jgi:hypothetical protein
LWLQSGSRQRLISYLLLSTHCPDLLLPLRLLPTEAPMSGGLTIRKPDLMINIPGSSAAAEPQLPYSQRPQPNMEFRGPQVRRSLWQHHQTLLEHVYGSHM